MVGCRLSGLLILDNEGYTCLCDVVYCRHGGAADAKQQAYMICLYTKFLLKMLKTSQ